MKMQVFRGISALLASALLAACAAGGTRESGSEAATTAESRAAARWELLIAAKPGEAYDFLAPGVRSTRTREQYVSDFANRPVKWVAAKVLGENCETDSCTVDIEVEYRVDLPARGVGTVQVPHREQERWVRIDGRWYHVPAAAVSGGLR